MTFKFLLEKKFKFYINAGFYIFNKNLFKYIKSKNESLEKNNTKNIKNKLNKILVYM